MKIFIACQITKYRANLRSNRYLFVIFSVTYIVFPLLPMFSEKKRKAKHKGCREVIPCLFSFCLLVCYVINPFLFVRLYSSVILKKHFQFLKIGVMIKESRLKARFQKVLQNHQYL